MKHVLFVCTGNTCRSPMAETLFRDLVKDRADYTVSSAGVGAYQGDLASAHTEQLMAERGLDMSAFRSRFITEEIVHEATHIFAMSRGHYGAIEDMFPEVADKLYLVSEFAPDDAMRGQDVNDPFGAPREVYMETRDTLLKILPSIKAYIDQTFDKTPDSKKS